MASSDLRRKDTTKGPPLRILSLDGGGVRGYSIFILLQELMHRTHVEIYGRAPRPHEIPKPCDHFDIIAGTGTGGLIAIMLGRLRLDLETCKAVYIRMTKRVFETDKTFAGIPYRSTLFKASKLEEAIRECVREHTIFEDEGNDSLAEAIPMTPVTPQSPRGEMDGLPTRSLSSASRASFSNPYSPSMSGRQHTGAARWGNANALLYDVREDRCKTAVTAVYKGSKMGSSAVLLRSYDSRKEPAPELNCAIWQAGRATAATALAFKPIQIGQSVFLDEGPGKYNPSPQILDEAVINEYPTRDIGVFMSIGTGKRPPNTGQRQSDWWEGFLGGSMGEFAEARRRLISKIEGCEETHQYMLKECLPKRGVNTENYYRLNVEVGVGEFGMNEWSRLSDISTNTRRYLAREDVQAMNVSASSKIARIHRAKQRWERANGDPAAVERPYSFEEQRDNEPIPPSDPMAIELPAEVPTDYAHPQGNPYPQAASQPPPQPPLPTQYPQTRAHVHRQSYDDKMLVSSEEYPPVPPVKAVPLPLSHTSSHSHQHNTQSQLLQLPQQPAEPYTYHHGSPPPLPPKTPLGDRPSPPTQSYNYPPVPNPAQAQTQGQSPYPAPLRVSPRHSAQINRDSVHTVQDGQYGGQRLSQPSYHPPANQSNHPGQPTQAPYQPPLPSKPPYPDPDGPPPVVDYGNKPVYGVRHGS